MLPGFARLRVDSGPSSVSRVYTQRSDKDDVGSGNASSRIDPLRERPSNIPDLKDVSLDQRMQDVLREARRLLGDDGPDVEMDMRNNAALHRTHEGSGSAPDNAIYISDVEAEDDVPVVLHERESAKVEVRDMSDDSDDLYLAPRPGDRPAGTLAVAHEKPQQPMPPPTVQATNKANTMRGIAASHPPVVAEVDHPSESQTRKKRKKKIRQTSMDDARPDAKKLRAAAAAASQNVGSSNGQDTVFDSARHLPGPSHAAADHQAAPLIDLSSGRKRHKKRKPELVARAMDTDRNADVGSSVAGPSSVLLQGGAAAYGGRDDRQASRDSEGEKMQKEVAEEKHQRRKHLNLKSRNAARVPTSAFGSSQDGLPTSADAHLRGQAHAPSDIASSLSSRAAQPPPAPVLAPSRAVPASAPARARACPTSASGSRPIVSAPAVARPRPRGPIPAPAHEPAHAHAPAPVPAPAPAPAHVPVPGPGPVLPPPLAPDLQAPFAEPSEPAATIEVPRENHERGRRIFVLPRSKLATVTLHGAVEVVKRNQGTYAHVPRQSFPPPVEDSPENVEDAILVGDTLVMAHSGAGTQISVLPLSLVKRTKDPLQRRALRFEVAHRGHPADENAQPPLPSRGVRCLAALPADDGDAAGADEPSKIRFLTGSMDHSVRLWTVTPAARDGGGGGGWTWGGTSDSLDMPRLSAGLCALAVGEIPGYDAGGTVLAAAQHTLRVAPLDHAFRFADARLPDVIRQIHVGGAASPHLVVVEVHRIDSQILAFDTRQPFFRAAALRFGHRADTRAVRGGRGRLLDGMHTRGDLQAGAGAAPAFVRGFEDGHVLLWDWRNVTVRAVRLFGRARRLDAGLAG